MVFPSSGLATLGGIRVRARVRTDAWGDRRTIIEGYLAFSFSVEHDGALSGSVYTGLEWHGLQTAPGTVPLGEWADLGFCYDGRDRMTLQLNGRVIAARYACLGPLGGIEWPYGLNIGAWPDEAARVFSGLVSEVWLWRMSR